MYDTDCHPYVFIGLKKQAECEPHTTVAPGWNLRMIFSTEPALAIIAIEAAVKKRATQRERIDALGIAMKKADKLIGEEADDPRLRDRAAWDFYNNYLYDLLEL